MSTLWSLERLRAPGGVLGLAVGGLVLAPAVGAARILRTLDLMSFPAAITLAVARVGCVVEGCCYGAETALPWGVRFPAYGHAWSDQLWAGRIAADAARSLPVHPLQLYLLALSTSVAVLLAWRSRAAARPGELFALFLLVHEGGKCVLVSGIDARRPPA